jgi:23S rRNA (cytidine1920-2'-O)/16S rRNA (cytidine1409-2'-O)-methyltransferase
LKYVSRAGLKLEGALQRTDLSVEKLICLDVGQSTGGFSDVLLAKGAAEVVGFDVGHGQLHARLRSHPRLKSFEGVNARDAAEHPILRGYLNKADLVVGDVSFISLRILLPELTAFLVPRGRMLFLVKPQFELARSHLNKKGVVRDAGDYERVEESIRSAVADQGLKLVDYFESCIVGQDGNREFFAYACRS